MAKAAFNQDKTILTNILNLNNTYYSDWCTILTQSPCFTTLSEIFKTFV
jgi:hypothetical protein